MLWSEDGLIFNFSKVQKVNNTGRGIEEEDESHDESSDSDYETDGNSEHSSDDSDDSDSECSDDDYYKRNEECNVLQDWN
jgi:hypothetical protein